jgi:intracellular sulfur oxidation DsrE/DsrF family protein
MRDKILLLTGDGIGRGDDRLGQVILANFLRVVGGRDELPAAIICMNGAVRLVCDGAEAFEAQEHLRELVAKGVAVYACKTCLEHFGLIERVVVGQIGGMPMFVEMMAAHQVITV